MSKNNALLRLFNFCQDPEKLTDEDWAKRVQEMWWALEFTGKIKRENGKLMFVNG